MNKWRTQIENQARYERYASRQQQEIDRLKGQEHRLLPATFDYTKINGLSSELREKLLQARPETVGQASRMQGMTPVAMSLLLLHLKSYEEKKSA